MDKHDMIKCTVYFFDLFRKFLILDNMSITPDYKFLITMLLMYRKHYMCLSTKLCMMLLWKQLFHARQLMQQSQSRMPLL